MRRLYVTCLVLLTAQIVQAATPGEITLARGYRFSDTLVDETSGARVQADEAAGTNLLISTWRDRQSSYDFYFSRLDTFIQYPDSLFNPLKARLDYYQLGGTVDYEHDYLHPFASGGIGLTRITTDDPDYSSETHLSLSVGVGLKIPLTQRMKLRIETRLLGTVLDASGSILCANGACSATLNGEMYLQFDTSAGISLSF